jgi:hypothetical protein
VQHTGKTLVIVSRQDQVQEGWMVVGRNGRHRQGRSLQSLYALQGRVEAPFS